MSDPNIRILLKALTWLIADTNTNTSGGNKNWFCSVSGELPTSRTLDDGYEKLSACGLPGFNPEDAP